MPPGARERVVGPVGVFRLRGGVGILGCLAFRAISNCIAERCFVERKTMCSFNPLDFGRACLSTSKIFIIFWELKLVFTPRA